MKRARNKKSARKHRRRTRPRGWMFAPLPPCVPPCDDFGCPGCYDPDCTQEATYPKPANDLGCDCNRDDVRHAICRAEWTPPLYRRETRRAA